MTYSFEDMNKFVKNSRKIRSTLLDKLAHGKDWTVESFAVRSNSREDLAEVIHKLADDLSTALKWIEKVHGENFAVVKELAEERKVNGKKAIEAVNSLQTAIDEKIVEPTVKLLEEKEAKNNNGLDWSTIDFKKTVSETVSKTVRAERRKEQIIEEKKTSFMLFGVRDETIGDGDDATWRDRNELAKDLVKECGVDVEELAKVNKLGRSGSAPIKVTLRNSWSVQRVLKQAYKFRDCGDPWNKLFISPNRTKEQQAAHQKLVKKLKEQILKDARKRWIIRNGAVVEIGPFERRRTSRTDRPEEDKWFMKPLSWDD